jgi:hypothetical protein
LLDLSQVTTNELVPFAGSAFTSFLSLVATGEAQIRGGLPIYWNDDRHVNRQSIPILEPHMGEVIRFIPKSELERARLVREARAIYDSIFPPVDAISEQGDDEMPLHQG